jgi:hypothetical protein
MLNSTNALERSLRPPTNNNSLHPSLPSIPLFLLLFLPSYARYSFARSIDQCEAGDAARSRASGRALQVLALLSKLLREASRQGTLVRRRVEAHRKLVAKEARAKTTGGGGGGEVEIDIGTGTDSDSDKDGSGSDRGSESESVSDRGRGTDTDADNGSDSDSDGAVGKTAGRVGRGPQPGTVFQRHLAVTLSCDTFESATRNLIL